MFFFSENDPEFMTLEMVAARVRLLVLYSLVGYLDKWQPDGTLVDVEKLVKEISDEVYRWEGKSKRYSFHRVYKANRERRNKAFQTNVLTFKKIQRYKNELLNRYRAKEITIDAETLTVWFVADLLNRAMDLHWHYVLIAILKIIFIYEYESVKTLRLLLERFQIYDFHPSDQKLRKWKSKTMREMRLWFGEKMLKITRITVGGRRELHFERPANPSENFDLAVECLNVQALPRHTCILNDAIKVKSDVIQLLEKLAVSEADAMERLIMHLLICPECLFTMLGALAIAGNPAHKLGLPMFRLDNYGGGAGSVPSGRRDVVKRLLEEKIDIKKELRRRDNRRNKLSLEYVLIVVDDTVRQKIFLADPQTVYLNLKPGESILQVRGEDDEGSLPLDVRYVPWNSLPADGRPLTFITKLKGNRRLKFSINYHTDKTGDLIGATAEISYVPKRAFSISKKSSAATPQKSHSWAGPIAVGATAIAVTLVAVGALFSRFSSSAPNNPSQRGLESASRMPDSTTTQSADTNSNDNSERNKRVDQTYDNTPSAGNRSIHRNAHRGETRHGASKITTGGDSLANSREPSFLKRFGKSITRRARALFAKTHKSFSAPQLLTLKGEIVDNNNRPIEAVKLSFKFSDVNGSNLQIVPSKKFELITDRRGKFTVCQISTGRYELVVKKDGYETTTIPSLHIWNGMRRPVRIDLLPESSAKLIVPRQNKYSRH